MSCISLFVYIYVAILLIAVRFIITLEYVSVITLRSFTVAAAQQLHINIVPTSYYNRSFFTTYCIVVVITLKNVIFFDLYRIFSYIFTYSLFHAA